MIESELQPKITESLEKLLTSVPFIQINNKSFQQRFGEFVADVVFNIKINGDTVKLILEAKSSGEPRQLRSAIQQLKYYGIIGGITRVIENKVYGIIGVPYISDDSAKICKENNIGYIDLAGNCFINYEKIYIERKNYPNGNIKKRSLRSIFTPKASRILRVMLCNPKKYWQVQELSEEAKISLGQAFKVKEKLLNLEYAKEENKMISLNKPEDLLSKWSENYSFRKNKLYDYFSFGEPKGTERKIAEYCKKNNIVYALTLFSGADLIAPYTRYTRAFIYIKENIPEIATSLELKPVDSGPNITILEPYDDGIFYGLQEINGMRVVCNIQLYLDLVNYKGRGEETGKFLFEQKIKPQW
ncbi:MAG: type IV toxin-antitoxin system AbiEi family antitoxin [Elusimicrobiota bacterium]